MAPENTDTKTMDVEAVDLHELQDMDATELLRFAFERFGGRAAIGTSLQKTGIVMIDIAATLGVDFRVFFIDTLLNHDETYDLLAAVEDRYGIEIERFRPDPDAVDELTDAFGQSAHFFNRQMCCRVRKEQPLAAALETLDVWISGLRADQSAHRKETARKASFVPDERHRRILKCNPLIDWSDEQVEQYTRDHNLPTNKLYEYVSPYGERYTVVGCRPCHVPVKDTLPKRMGKFPWEQGIKECGIHVDGGGI